MAKYKVHIFNSSNTLNISSLTGVEAADTLEYYVVAGGGSGGYSRPGNHESGAGGAGGFLTGNSTITAANILSIVLGAGGNNNNGNPSKIFGLDVNAEAIGGGRGGGYNPGGATNGIPGGSGGGGAGSGPTSTARGGGTGTTGQGNAGGTGFGSGFGGGGGGAGGVGSPNPGGSGGTGGIGLSISWLPSDYGTPGPAPGRYFAGGGGAQSKAGGSGGGGAGSPGGAPAQSGVSFTGGGGGSGGIPANAGGVGGSGLVIVRYPFFITQTSAKISKITDISSNVSSIYVPNTSVTFTISTVLSTEGQTYYYDTIGNVTNSTFAEGNTGTFSVSANIGNVSLTILDVDETSRNFKLRVRRSNTSAILKESNVIHINNL